jgi:hypothetical protein
LCLSNFTLRANENAIHKLPSDLSAAGNTGESENRLKKNYLLVIMILPQFRYKIRLSGEIFSRTFIINILVILER